MQVEPASPADLAAIRSCYADGRTMQRESGSPLWPEFTDAAILAEMHDTLIAFYRTRGFGLVRTRRIPLDSPLSEHYRGIELALLERSLKARR